jgi:mannose-6-phosphate isomerase-like protein (cupin superfamily)
MKLLLVSLVLGVWAVAPAYGQQPKPTQTYISSAEVQATVNKTASLPVSDQALRIVSINNGEYNVAAGIVHRAKTAASATPNGISHSEITEMYHVISGSGVLITGGTLEDPTPAPADSPTVALLNGPSTRGGAIRNGVSQRIGPGDIIIIPPNTPHWFSEISTDKIVYLIVRIDPKKVLPAGYMPPAK